MATIGHGFEWMKMLRGLTLAAIQDLSPEQLRAVPQGFNNNVLWNVGHLLYEQCQVFYSLTQQPFPFPPGCAEQYKALFDNGTAPKTWVHLPDTPEILARFAAITDTIIADAASGKFDGFRTFELSPGVSIDTVSEAAAFHCVHEGMHLGAINALKKFI